MTLTYDDPVFWDYRLTALVQGLEGFHRSTIERKKVSLASRIESLADALPGSLKCLVAPDSAQLAARLKDLRHDISHGGLGLGPKPVGAGERLEYEFRAKLLLVYHLLREAAVPEQVLATRLPHSREGRYLARKS